jgi:hypothetical protein
MRRKATAADSTRKDHAIMSEMNMRTVSGGSERQAKPSQPAQSSAIAAGQRTGGDAIARQKALAWYAQGFWALFAVQVLLTAFWVGSALKLFTVASTMQTAIIHCGSILIPLSSLAYARAWKALSAAQSTPAREGMEGGVAAPDGGPGR